MPMTSAKPTKDPLSLRVMRLSQPRLASSVWARTDALVQSSLSSNPSDPQAEILIASEGPRISENFALQLPTQQGRVFAGEVFRAYVNVVNPSTGDTIQNVSLLVELGTGNTKNILFDNRSTPITRLAPHQSLDAIIECPIETTGSHVLVCQIFYTSPYFDINTLDSNSPKSIKKTYRFPALPPFKIHHRLHFVPNRVFVECSIENQTGMTLHLEDASLICSPGVKGVRLHNANEKVLFKGISNLRSRDVHNILFSLEPDQTQTDIYFLKRSQSLGRLALSWRLPTGGAGKLDNYQIDNHIEIPLPIELRVTSCPSTVQVEVPFIVEFECINRSTEWIAPMIHIAKEIMAPVYLQGEIQKIFSPIAPNTNIVYPVTLIAIVPGLHSLRGITLRNSIDGEILHAPDILASVLVF